MAALAGSIVLFGGLVNDNNGSHVVGDTWLWNGSTWTQWMGQGPAPRSDHVMAALGGTIVLFGGADTQQVFGDTWVWKGAGWSEVATSGPPGRSDAVMTSYAVPAPSH
jgi:hypothetical protein